MWEHKCGGGRRVITVSHCLYHCLLFNWGTRWFINQDPLDHTPNILTKNSSGLHWISCKPGTNWHQMPVLSFHGVRLERRVQPFCASFFYEEHPPAPISQQPDIGLSPVNWPSISSSHRQVKWHKDSKHLIWLPSVPRHTVACGTLWLASVRLIRKKDEHVNCFLVSGGQQIQDRLLAFLKWVTRRAHANAHAHLYDELFPPSPTQIAERGRRCYRDHSFQMSGLYYTITLEENIFHCHLCLKVNSNSDWQMHLYCECWPENIKIISLM